MSTVPTAAGETVQFCICKQCRRFWLERDGWLLSRREAVALLRSWPVSEHLEAMAK